MTEATGNAPGGWQAAQADVRLARRPSVLADSKLAGGVAAILDATLRGELTEMRAQPLYAYGPEAVALVLLTITRQVVEGSLAL